MKFIYIRASEAGEIVGLSSNSFEMPVIQPGFIKLPDNHPDIDFISIDSHFVNSSGEVVRYSPELAAVKKSRPSYKHQWNVQTGWVDTTTVDEFRQRKTREINEERERRNLSPITYESVLFDADEEAQRNVSAWMVNIAAGQNPPSGFVWRGYDNVNHPADAAFVVGLGNAITMRGTYLYQRSWIKKAEIDALTTPEDVKAYDVTAGW